HEPIGAIELALQATLAAEPIEARIREAEKKGLFDGDPRANVRDIAVVAFEKQVITSQEMQTLQRRNHLRDIVIRVDDFPFDLGKSAAAEPPALKLAA
ncbi:MAG: acyl-CoA dehydrogenase, partial [Pseudomonadota bacterium]